MSEWIQPVSELGQAIAKSMDNGEAWFDIDYDGWVYWWEHGVGYSRTVEGVGSVTLIELRDTSTFDSYGYSDRGEAWMVFRVSTELGHAKYYKKFGRGSSYSSPYFNEGSFVEVQPKTETVTIYSYE